MKKTFLVTGLLALATVVLPLGAAQAQTLEGDIGFSKYSDATAQHSIGDPVEGASGSYHVIIQFMGTFFGLDQYSVNITGNADGVYWQTVTHVNATPGHPAHDVGSVPTYADTGLPDNRNLNPPPGHPGNGYNVAKSGVEEFTLKLSDAGGNSILVNNNPFFQPAGSTTAYGAPPGPALGQNWGGNPTNAQRYGAVGGSWSTSDPDPGDPFNSSVEWKADGTRTTAIAPRGGNSFTGTFYLDPNSHDIQTAHLSMQDNGQQWSGDLVAPPVPEPGSLALLLPGLMPLGFALRRRRSSR